MVAEDVVPVASGATRALQAAGEEQGHAYRHQNSEGVFIDHEPANQAIHRQSPGTTDLTRASPLSGLRCSPLLTRFQEQGFLCVKGFIDYFSISLLFLRE
jgi:hypothetical protein